MRLIPTALLGVFLLTACGQNSTAPTEPVTSPATPAFERTDYADLDTWLCHPGKSVNDACKADLTATVIEEDGSTRIETFEAATDPAFDCFYFYPTVSLDTTPNSDMTAGPEELSVVANQFARYGSACRLYAPIYRQATLLSLRTAMLTGTATADAEMRWADIVDSWEHYLEHENNGRGVLLVGHSQGSGMILELLNKEIIGTPVQDRIVAAHPIGTLAHLDEDGTFGGMPVCDSADQTGCILTYVTFRSEAPPPPESRFGKITETGDRAICASPPALSGDGVALDAYMPRASAGVMENAQYGVEFDTPFVKLPGLLSGECLTNATHDWFAVTINAADGPRTDNIQGDIIANGEVLADWGLHFIDVNLTMGNLVEIARQQGESWAEK
ncbi:MAG: DUF3089 domain-containing protein [Hyphomonas sp.]